MSKKEKEYVRGFLRDFFWRFSGIFVYEYNLIWQIEVFSWQVRLREGVFLNTSQRPRSFADFSNY